jgi:hypothetical protein
VLDCKLLKYEWVTMRNGQDAELKAEKYGWAAYKMLEKLGCEKYTSKYGISLSISYTLI